MPTLYRVDTPIEHDRSDLLENYCLTGTSNYITSPLPMRLWFPLRLSTVKKNDNFVRIYRLRPVQFARPAFGTENDSGKNAILARP